MKKCSTKTPDFKLLEFAENPQRKNIYDLVPSTSTFDKFKYFRLETPKQPYLIQQGAKYVCESWENSIKILHTGLIPTGTNDFYFGDFAEMIKNKKKTSLIIFFFVPGTTKIEVYYFNHFNKRSIVMKLQFIQAFISNLKRIKTDKKREEVTTPPLNVQTKPNSQMLGMEMQSY